MNNPHLSVIYNSKKDAYVVSSNTRIIDKVTDRKIKNLQDRIAELTDALAHKECQFVQLKRKYKEVLRHTGTTDDDEGKDSHQEEQRKKARQESNEEEEYEFQV